MDLKTPRYPIQYIISFSLVLPNLMWEYFSETPRQKSFRTVNTCGHKSFLTQTGYIVI